MTNYNDRDSYSREISERREIQQNPDNTVPTQVTQTTETVHHHNPHPSNMVYRDGYLQGRMSEQQLNEANQTARDNESAARGLLIGIIFTGLAALVIGAVFLLNQRSQTPVLIQRIAPTASPSPSPSPQVRDRIIERDRVVPVPQPQAPQVNIAVPNSGQSTAPSTQTAPGSSSTQTAPGTSSSQTAPSDSSAGGQSGTSGTGQTGNGAGQ